MKNKYEIRGNITVIFTMRRKQEIIIDTIDLWRFLGLQKSWFVISCGYAATNYREDGKLKTLLLHRFLLDAPEDMCVDHINHDRLDNRRENIRIVTKGQNNQNRVVPQNNKTSKHLNVHWSKSQGKWRVVIQNKGKKIHVGYFDDIDEAKEVSLKARAKFIEYSREAKTMEVDGEVIRTKESWEPRLDKKSCDVKNVFWNKVHQKWVVIITRNKKRHSFGSYNDLEEAKRVAEIARKTL